MFTCQKKGQCLHACINLAVIKGCAACRLVRVNVTEGISPDTWTEILPQHEKDLLSGTTVLKVQRALGHSLNWQSL